MRYLLFTAYFPVSDEVIITKFIIFNKVQRALIKLKNLVKTLAYQTAKGNLSARKIKCGINHWRKLRKGFGDAFSKLTRNRHVVQKIKQLDILEQLYRLLGKCPSLFLNNMLLIHRIILKVVKMCEACYLQQDMTI